MPETPTIRVVIVEDQDQVRDGLRTFFDAYDELELVGAATDSQEAIRQCFDL